MYIYITQQQLEKSSLKFELWTAISNIIKIETKDDDTYPKLPVTIDVFVAKNIVSMMHLLVALVLVERFHTSFRTKLGKNYEHARGSSDILRRIFVGAITIALKTPLPPPISDEEEVIPEKVNKLVASTLNFESNYVGQCERMFLRMIQYDCFVTMDDIRAYVSENNITV